MPFLTPLRVEYVDGTTARLLEDLVYEGRYDRFTVPAGYETDFASVPWWVQSILPRTGKWTKAAAVHDILCSERNYYHKAMRDYLHGRITTAQFLAIQEPISPRDVDGVFRRIMREQGVDPVRRWLMWMGVRWGALMNPARRRDWWHWRSAPGTIAISLATLVAFFGSWWAVHVFVDWVWPW